MLLTNNYNERNFSFLPAVMTNSGRISGDFLRLLLRSVHLQSTNMYDAVGRYNTRRYNTLASRCRCSLAPSKAVLIENTAFALDTPSSPPPPLPPPASLHSSRLCLPLFCSARTIKRHHHYHLRPSKTLKRNMMTDSIHQNRG
jgi:hypothetical protein